MKRKHKNFTCTSEDQLTNTIPPVFSPNGKYFLVLNEHNHICKFIYPEMQLIRAIESEEEDDPFAESLCYLDNGRVLASTNDGRIFLLDGVGMKVNEEVTLDGHETRPIGEYYPTLAHESRLATDISYFRRLGDFIVFVFRRDQARKLNGWKDSLLWYSVKPDTEPNAGGNKHP